MEQELEVARTIQETLVPPNEPVAQGHFKFAGYFQPASQCGGDWWTWHQLVGDKILIVIGDVTGHGVPSAMITAAAKAACDVARSVYQDDVAVAKLLEIMNYASFESAKRKFVMTCFAAILALTICRRGRRSQPSMPARAGAQPHGPPAPCWEQRC